MFQTVRTKSRAVNGRYETGASSLASLALKPGKCGRAGKSNPPARMVFSPCRYEPCNLSEKGCFLRCIKQKRRTAKQRCVRILHCVQYTRNHLWSSLDCEKTSTRDVHPDSVQTHPSRDQFAISALFGTSHAPARSPGVKYCG